MERTYSTSAFKTKELILVALFTALSAVGAFIRIPLPMIPFSMQNLFTTLSGLLLGSYLGSVAVALYVILGLIGLPIFTQGGGIGYVLKPSFGYLLGFILGAWITGKLRERASKNDFKSILLANAAGMASIYVIGVGYYYVLSTFLLGQPLGAKVLLVNFVLMTLPGDIVKCFVVTALGKKLLPVLK